jgi:hypothetical protein
MISLELAMLIAGAYFLVSYFLIGLDKRYGLPYDNNPILDSVIETLTSAETIEDCTVPLFLFGPIIFLLSIIVAISWIILYLMLNITCFLSSFAIRGFRRKKPRR